MCRIKDSLILTEMEWDEHENVKRKNEHFVM